MILDLHLGKEANLTISYNLYDNDVSRLFYQRMSEQQNAVVAEHNFITLAKHNQK